MQHLLCGLVLALAGTCAGPVFISRGPGEPARYTQTELVQFKLDGLVLQVEGTTRDAAGKVAFQALATISYDSETAGYRLRAYNDGRYLDTELKVVPKGFEWGYTAGPLKIRNVMRVSEKGEWVETTESVYAATPPRKSVEMTLRRQP